MLLGEIARIKVGVVLSRKKAGMVLEVRAKYPLISLKNIQGDGTFTKEPIEMFESKEEIGKEFFTREGNILIRLSHPNTAILIDKEREGLLIPSCFANIELHHEAVLPAYVAWYLNTEKVKGDLLKSQAGTNIPSTNKQVLEKVRIPELDVSKQEMIIEIQQLYHEEKRLYQELMLEKEKFYRSVLYSIVKTD